MADSLPDEYSSELARVLAGYAAVPELGRRFNQAGHELYLVGGTVRDALLGRIGKDLDFATSATPLQSEEVLRRWARNVWLTGARFGTVSAEADGVRVEVTTFRSESYTPGSRHPDVEFAGDITTDLSRRDFTVNAMAVRLPTMAFVDPFNGLKDLAERTIRTPIAAEKSFADDPLRMVRLARFVATLDAAADAEAVAAARAMAFQLDSISRERIREEFSRLMMAEHPRPGLDLLCDTKLADRFVPELPALRMERDPHHRHKDVYKHTLAVVERCNASDLVLRLAALLHDIGKPHTRQYHADGKVTFHNHDMVGARLARRRLTELRYPNSVVDEVSALVALHLRFHGYSDGVWSDSAVRRYVHDAGGPEQLVRLNRLTRADVTTANRDKARRLGEAMDDLEARIERLARQEELDAMRPALNGNQIMQYLGLEPGPLVGKAWHMLLQARIDEGPMSEERAYQLLAEWAAETGVRSPEN